MPDLNYIPQVSQLEALQLPQELPPIEELSPLSSLEKQAKVDIIRLAVFWHWGQETSSSAWLKERNSSNFKPQPEHIYSYSGTFFPPHLI
jgi:hypothetical protein